MSLIYFGNTDFSKTIDPHIMTGDALVFRGVGFVSDAIETLTGWLSHFASCIRLGPAAWLIESTTLDGKNGVQINRASKRVDDYQVGSDGAVYLLRLSAQERSNLRENDFRTFLYAQVGKPYDKLLIAHLFFDRFQLVPAKPNWQSWICSELGAEAAEKSGLLPASIDAAEVTPSMMAKYKMWDSDYYQVKGVKAEIPGFNSVEIPGR